MNNTTKARLQSVFRALHTWEWVPPGMDWLRVIVIGVMVGSLLALGLTGIAMLVTVRRKKRLPGTEDEPNPDIILKSCIAISEEDVTVAKARLLSHWRLEYMSLRAEEEQFGVLEL